MNIEIMVPVAIAVAVGGAILAVKFRCTFVVREGQAGLLYHKGRFVKVYPVGQHVFWGTKFTFNTVDIRKAVLVVPAQEVLTADNVGVKVSLAVTYQVIDPAKATHDTQNWLGDLYNAAQLAARAVVGGIAVEALLGQRLDIGAQLLARVQPEADRIGIGVTTVDVKDLTFTADLKRAFADVLKAK